MYTLKISNKLLIIANIEYYNSNKNKFSSILINLHKSKTIGNYNKIERIKLLNKFHKKRIKRNEYFSSNCNKIRYSVRKNLADSRIRIKGRFVKKTI